MMDQQHVFIASYLCGNRSPRRRTADEEMDNLAPNAARRLARPDRVAARAAAVNQGRKRIVSLTQYYTATTLDGFIADPDNSLDWLFTRQREDDGPLNYGEFIANVGAMAMGSTTYEWILDHEFADKDPAEWKWPYEIPCWVFTHRQLPVVPDSGIEFTSADIPTVHEEMVDAAGDRNVWIVGGGDLAGQFADVGLLDEVIVSIAPVTLGAGAPLLPRRIELRLDELGRNGDLACAKFSVVRTAV